MVTHIIRKHLFPVLGLSLIKRESFFLYFFLEKLDIVYTYPTTLSILSKVEPLCIVSLLKRIQDAPLFPMYVVCPLSLFVCALSHVGLCNPMDCNPPCSSIHGIS